MLDGAKHKLTVVIAPSKNITYFNTEQCKNYDGEFLCKCCGHVVTQAKGRKHKPFCTDECRQYWHRLNRDMGGTQKTYCKYSGKEFMYYKGDRKYCSCECYIIEQFG